MGRPHCLPYGLVLGPDGKMYLAEFGKNTIGRIDPADGSLKEFTLPDSMSRPRRLIVDPSGIVWYSDYHQHRLGRLDPRTGAVTDFPTPLRPMITQVSPGSTKKFMWSSTR